MEKENRKVVPCTRIADQLNVSGFAYLIRIVAVEAPEAVVKKIPRQLMINFLHLPRRLLKRKHLSRAPAP